MDNFIMEQVMVYQEEKLMKLKKEKIYQKISINTDLNMKENI